MKTSWIVAFYDQGRFFMFHVRAGCSA
jgi:hypothetical protein